MPKNKFPSDTNQLAKVIVTHTTDETKEPDSLESYAAQFARKGGLVGGPARAAKLSPERRKEIAMKAARTRWGK